QYLGGTVDAFHFVYQPMSTNGTIIARVTSGSTAGAQVSVMMRETLDADAANVAVGSVLSSSMLVHLYERSFRAGYEFQNNGVNSAWPYWMKVVRDGNQFTVYEFISCAKSPFIQVNKHGRRKYTSYGHIRCI